MSTHPVGNIPEWTMGDRLRKARETTGLNAQDFAAEIGTSRGTVANAESGKHSPSRLVLNAWAMRTGVPLQWLETGVAPTGPEDGGESQNARTHVWVDSQAAALVAA